MKKYLLGIAMILSVVCYAKADTFSYTFLFNESDFSITKKQSDSLSIVSVATPAAYPAVTDPGLPIIGRSIALTDGGMVKDYSVVFNKRLIRSGVDIDNAPRPLPTNMLPQDMPKEAKGYIAKIYPDSNCVLVKNFNIGGVPVASFLMSPFVFDAKNRNLYFIDSIRIDMEIGVNPMRKAPDRMRPAQFEILQAVVDNRESLESLPIAYSEPESNETVEYVIITNERLKDAFQPLADWKRKKGVPSKIITVEEIYQNYPGQTQQIKIKSCIIDLCKNNWLQFVLLGGDVDIVPTQPCCVNSRVGTFIEYDIPADVYYSSLADLDWDTNNDGIAGELGFDRIDVNPVVHVTRAPVNDISQTELFVTRTIEYEQSPNFRRAIFQGGTRLNKKISGDKLADMLFNDVFAGKIRIESHKFFDTYMYNGQPFSTQSFSEGLSSGYMLAEFISHGKENSLVDSIGKSFYNTKSASSLSNSGHTVFTTMACLTNAFDKPEQCLSEALFRNPNSGLVGYLGSSRSGWFNGDEYSFDYSMGYERLFYELLFDSNSLRPAVKHFGALVTFTKSSFLSYLNSEQTYRWLHYSINALGDPETPIFNDYPKSFDASSTGYNNGYLTVNTGVENARVCVSSVSDSSYYEIDYGKECVFHTGQGNFDVWITSQNYIPKKHTVKYIIEKPVIPFDPPTRIISISPNPTSDYVTVKYFASSKDVELLVAFTSVSGGKRLICDITNENGEATIDLGTLPSGMYAVNLIEDGILIKSDHRVIKM